MVSITTPRPRPGSRAAHAEEIVELLPALVRRFKAEFPSDIHEQLASVTHLQMQAVDCLAREEGGLSMNDLAKAQGCALSTATAMADRLIKQGLVERVADPADRRIVRLAPTAQALAFRARFAEAKRQAALAVVRSLDTEEMATLVRLLAKLARDEGKAVARG